MPMRSPVTFGLAIAICGYGCWGIGRTFAEGPTHAPAYSTAYHRRSADGVDGVTRIAGGGDQAQPSGQDPCLLCADLVCFTLCQNLDLSGAVNCDVCLDRAIRC